MSTESVIVTAPDEAGADAPAVDVTRLRVALARLARRLRKHELAGLTPTQLAALATVERSGPMRLGDLAAAEGIAPSTLTRLVTALEESDYVRRHADPSDARASTLAITPRGATRWSGCAPRPPWSWRRACDCSPWLSAPRWPRRCPCSSCWPRHPAPTRPGRGPNECRH